MTHRPLHRQRQHHHHRRRSHRRQQQRHDGADRDALVLMQCSHSVAAPTATMTTLHNPAQINMHTLAFSHTGLLTI